MRMADLAVPVSVDYTSSSSNSNLNSNDRITSGHTEMSSEQLASEQLAIACLETFEKLSIYLENCVGILVPMLLDSWPNASRRLQHRCLDGLAFAVQG